LPKKIEQTECSETSTYKIQTPGSYPEENILHKEHSESLKSRIFDHVCGWTLFQHVTSGADKNVHVDMLVRNSASSTGENLW